ncbi:MAG: hypothetical protein WC603_00105 [Candidatus Paceibacterota bacterium]|jgi:hypothetical protein
MKKSIIFSAIIIAVVAMSSCQNIGIKNNSHSLIFWPTGNISSLKVAPADSTFEARKGALKAKLTEITREENQGEVIVKSSVCGCNRLTVNYDTNSFFAPGSFFLDWKGRMFLMVGVTPFPEPGKSRVILPYFLMEGDTGVGYTLFGYDVYPENFSRVL